MQQLKIWIVIKQSTNLELNEQFWSQNECERAHPLTTTTTGSKNSQKEANNQTSNQNSTICILICSVMLYTIIHVITRHKVF